MTADGGRRPQSDQWRLLQAILKTRAFTLRLRHIGAAAQDERVFEMASSATISIPTLLPRSIHAPAHDIHHCGCRVPCRVPGGLGASRCEGWRGVPEPPDPLRRALCGGWTERSGRAYARTKDESELAPDGRRR